MPNALLGMGMSTHAYIILFGSLVGMLPSVLDSLLVNIYFTFTLIIELNKNTIQS